MAIVAYPVWHVLDSALGRSLWRSSLPSEARFAAGLATYLISCRLLGVRELEALLSLLGRFRRG